MSDQAVVAGKLVSITYSIRDEAGTLLEHNNIPVSYIHGGQTELIGGMDRAVAGKHAGDEVDMLLSAEEAFGPHDPNLTFTDEIDNVPPELHYVGAELPMQSSAGDVRTFYVTRIENGSITVDGNHPLAGRRLRVQVRVREVRDPTEQELLADIAHRPPSAVH